MGCSPSKVVPANPDHEQGLGGIEDPRELGLGGELIPSYDTVFESKEGYDVAWVLML